MIKAVYNIAQKIIKKIRILLFKFFYKKSFVAFGKNSYIYRPIRLTPKFISLENYVQINDFARIEGIDRYNEVIFKPVIIFHSYVSVQQNLHLTCASKIEIGKHTAIAANVSITDLNHPYSDISVAPEYQDIEVDEVFIGENCKIYNNAVIGVDAWKIKISACQ